MKNYYVYILASSCNGTLYVGSTSNLVKRIWGHKNNVIKGFTEKYYVHQLVYYECRQQYMEAARRASKNNTHLAAIIKN
jgi:putative endonuclease